MHVALMFLVVVVKIYNRGLGCRRIKAFRFHYMFDCGLLDLRDALVSHCWWFVFRIVHT